MFSSLASLIFGSTTSATTHSEVNQNPGGQQDQQKQRIEGDDVNVRIDDATNSTIEVVTSSTPSIVTGAGVVNVVGRQGGSRRSGRNKRNRNGNRNGNGNGNGKSKKPNATGETKTGKPSSASAAASVTPSLAKLLTPSDSCDEELDDDWFIVENEVDEEDSLPRTDSEEELPIVEVKSVKPSVVTSTQGQGSVSVTASAPISGSGSGSAHQHQQHRHRQPSSHITVAPYGGPSLYGGPRPQQQRNRLQRNRVSRSGIAYCVPTLSPTRSIGVPSHGSHATADGGLSQSLYHVPTNGNDGSGGNNNNPSSIMEESWFVTPPPCFTSIGPINMETSPYENLLIEHPSMSVYHSIRSAQEATDSFVNLDLGVNEIQRQRRRDAGNPTAILMMASPVAPAGPAAAQAPTMPPTPASASAAVRGNQVASVTRSVSVRIDRYGAMQAKQELLARNSEKKFTKVERQNMCRSAIERSNKVREYQGRGNQRQRRSDMQHFRLLSGANNNRKC